MCFPCPSSASAAEGALSYCSRSPPESNSSSSSSSGSSVGGGGGTGSDSAPATTAAAVGVGVVGTIVPVTAAGRFISGYRSSTGGSLREDPFFAAACASWQVLI